MTVTTLEYYRRQLAEMIRDRPWISATGVLVQAAADAQLLLELGASRVLAIGTTRGTGELPDPMTVPQVDLDVPGEDMMSAIRAGERALRNLPGEVQRRIEKLDPEGSARVLGSIFTNGLPVGGRAIFGARPESWRRLEDKVVIDEVWDRAGIARVPAKVVPVDRDAVRRAAEEVAGAGDYVLAGDAREGFNGGGQYLRWIRGDAPLASAMAFFREHCDSVRVMPFLEGVPCSIHGIVFPGHVAALRPCELIVLRDPSAPRLVYAGSASYWEAPREAAEELREAARRMGAYLSSTVGYRGTFTIDGVLTRAGFRPTELNPRFGAALSVATGNLELPLMILNAAIVEGVELDWQPRRFEALLLEHLAGNPNGKGIQLFEKRIESGSDGGLCQRDGRWLLAEEGETADATFSLGPNPVGGFLRVMLESERTPRNRPVAPLIASALRFVDELFELGLGPLEAPPEVEE